jgi:aromatic ring-opening dioxygenase LigB subunit
MYAPLEANLSKGLLDMMHLHGENVTGLLNFADSEPEALRWGEVVPLWFMRKWLNSSHTLIMSMPQRRYVGSGAPMVDELLEVGRLTREYLDSVFERVLVVVSSDLAHTHLASGPYGFSPAAEPFDEAVGRWGSTLNRSELTEAAASFAPDALSCGFTGLVFLDGVLGRDRERWQPRNLANFHPTYYGMMVASFLDKQSASAADHSHLQLPALAEEMQEEMEMQQRQRDRNRRAASLRGARTSHREI